MKHIIYILIFIPILIHAQTGFQNFGNIQIHDNANMGFHTNLINDGVFDTNLGFAGFYNEEQTLEVSGTQKAIFYNLEVAVEDDLELYTSLGVTNEMLFTTGLVITPRDDISVSLDFINHDIYAGEGDDQHVDGYATVIGKDEFVFPIGDGNRIRPLIIPATTDTQYFRAAFFNENPNDPSVFTESFSTESREMFLEKVLLYGFWDLDGSPETKVTLTWDYQNHIATIANTIDLLRVVGWNPTRNKWEDLGRAIVTGDTDEGTITSNSFIPDNYTVLSIGSEYAEYDGSENYFISPNNDGFNDFLIFEGLDQFVKNELQIYNRWGDLVYKEVNYENDWEAFSNSGKTFNISERLPTGTYFYFLTIDDDYPKKKRGWVYVQR